jgi:hypothetical protein
MPAPWAALTAETGSILSATSVVSSCLMTSNTPRRGWLTSGSASKRRRDEVRQARAADVLKDFAALRLPGFGGRLARSRSGQLESRGYGEEGRRAWRSASTLTALSSVALLNRPTNMNNIITMPKTVPLRAAVFVESTLFADSNGSDYAPSITMNTHLFA